LHGVLEQHPLEVRLPEAGTELGSFVVIARPGAPPGVLTLLPTLPGEQVLPAFRVEVARPGGAALAFSSEPLQVVVQSALQPGEPLELRADLRLEPIPRGRSWLAWALGLVLLAAIGAWLVRRARQSAARKRAVRPAAGAGRPADPAAGALERLRELQGGAFAAGEAAREALAEVADLLRRVLAASAGIPALCRTTEELLPQVALLAGARRAQPSFPLGVLPAADLAKYAAAVPGREEVMAAAEEALRWAEERRARGGSP
ncbi:MAG: hypothetical protein HY812_02360, partial [Planctomycetes bacterium]|nr:hypothetical protein [Planctomycetota bacterium]